VLALVRVGQPTKAISAALKITPRAVEMRRSTLMMSKLSARSLAELLRLSIELGPLGENGEASPDVMATLLSS